MRLVVRLIQLGGWDKCQGLSSSLARQRSVYTHVEVYPVSEVLQAICGNMWVLRSMTLMQAWP